MIEPRTIFAPLMSARGLLLAISGGPDSVALLSLICKWRALRPDAPAIAAATVDHGLRAESLAEAESVARLSAGFGLPHFTLPWTGRKPRARLQERAREARYGLLTEKARELGFDTIVTAHHRDDQAETVLMRVAKGSGVAGLSGMARLSERHGLRLARPLLAESKAALLAYCRSEGLSFADDPSNRDIAYERVRTRALIAEAGFDARALARLADRAARAEAALSAMTDSAEARLPLAPQTAPAAAWLTEPDEIRLRLLCRAILRTGGDRRLRLQQVEALSEALSAAAASGRTFSQTLAGLQIRITPKGLIEIRPEPPRRLRAASARASENLKEMVNEND